jgi:predicted ATPase
MERHPLEPIIHEFQRDFGQIQIDLNQVDGRGFVETLLDSKPNRLDKAFREALYRHSGGNPLFTVEILRSLQDRGELVKDENGRWVAGRQLDWDQLPTRVEAVVAERFDRLPARCQSTLAVASVQGQDFIAAIVAQARSSGVEAIIDCLSDLVCRQHRLVQAIGTEHLGGQHITRFRFRHKLFHQYAYQQMDTVTKDRMHKRTAMALESLYAGHIEERALELGHHFEAAGWAEKAAGYFLLAGKRAYLMAANQTAIDHFRHGLLLLKNLPETSSEEKLAERMSLELSLLMALGAPLRARQGFATPEVGRVYARARDLARQVGDADRLFTAQLLLWTTYLNSAQYQQAHEAGTALYDLAKISRDPGQLAQANLAQGMVQFYQGEFSQALAHLEAAIAGYDPEKQGVLISPVGQDVRIAALISSARLLWFLGCLEKALQRSQEVLAQTQALDHPYSKALALCMAG